MTVYAMQCVCACAQMLGPLLWPQKFVVCSAFKAAYFFVRVERGVVLVWACKCVCCLSRGPSQLRGCVGTRLHEPDARSNGTDGKTAQSRCLDRCWAARCQDASYQKFIEASLSKMRLVAL